MFGKKYDHKSEQAIYQMWLENNCFAPVHNDDPEKKFVMTLPPPNVTGVLHIGHAMMASVEDAMVRYHRGKGYETLWLPGTDHAGIATQSVVEKSLLAEEKKHKEDIGREAFMQRLRDWSLQSRTTINSQFTAMGASVDWSREQFTMSEQLSRAVRKAFKKLYDTDKIYQSNYMVNRSPGAKSVVSDLEVEYREEESKLYYIRYYREGKGDCLTVATVRPETIFADVAIAVNPKDKRYKDFIGKNVLIPIINKPIPVIADERVVEDFGTGALKITPTHSSEDYHIARDHNLPMDQYAFDKQEIYTDIAGEFFAGKNIRQRYENLIQHLSDIDNLEKIEPYTTSIPYCERTGTRIQPLLSNQWFCIMEAAAIQVQQSLETEQVHIHPPRFQKALDQRLGDLKPRCISRQLWRGHRIPVWSNGTHKRCIDEDTIYDQEPNVMALILFNLIADGRLSNPFSIEQLIDILLESCVTPTNTLVYQNFLSMYRKKYHQQKSILKQCDAIENIFASLDHDSKLISKAAEQLEDMLASLDHSISKGDQYQMQWYLDGQRHTDLVHDPDVLDTWFSSALRPFTTLGRPEQSDDYDRYYPNTVLETGYDIITFWVLRMMLMGVAQTDQLPFAHVYLHGLVRDPKGRKMSKSLGNVINPLDLIEKYGADALRASLVHGSTPGNDIKFSLQKVEYMSRFITKVWNASRFVMMKFFGETAVGIYDVDQIKEDILMHTSEFNPYDLWILSRLSHAQHEYDHYMSKYMLGEALQVVIDFVWNELCDRYIEICKITASDYSPKLLLRCLASAYKLLHPYMPFVTEQLRQSIGLQGILAAHHHPLLITIDMRDYKANLLMDMIAAWRTMRSQATSKTHEQISLAIKGSHEMLHFVQSQESIVKALLNASTIHYIGPVDTIADSFILHSLYDFTLGVQATTASVDWKQQLQLLEKTLVEDEQFLQSMRSTMASPSFISKAPPAVIAERQEKMQQLKQKITQTQLEIQKIKIKLG